MLPYLGIKLTSFLTNFLKNIWFYKNCKLCFSIILAAICFVFELCVCFLVQIETELASRFYKCLSECIFTLIFLEFLRVLSCWSEFFKVSTCFNWPRKPVSFVIFLPLSAGSAYSLTLYSRFLSTISEELSKKSCSS